MKHYEQKQHDTEPGKGLEKLVQTAIQLGASVAGIISSADIVTEDRLADLCHGEPTCINYGLSPSCPPHVSGPSGFRKLQSMSRYSIVVKIDVPTAIMFSLQRHEIMQVLHEIVSTVERKAVEIGYGGSKAFAGDSCKKIFCNDHATCRVLSKQGECRNPDTARPSMSGFGIDVASLLRTAGWPAKTADHEQASDMESMTWVAGLIVLAPRE